MYHCTPPPLSFLEFSRYINWTSKKQIHLFCLPTYLFWCHLEWVTFCFLPRAHKSWNFNMNFRVVEVIRPGTGYKFICTINNIMQWLVLQQHFLSSFFYTFFCFLFFKFREMCKLGNVSYCLWILQNNSKHPFLNLEIDS